MTLVEQNIILSRVNHFNIDEIDKQYLFCSILHLFENNSTPACMKLSIPLPRKLKLLKKKIDLIYMWMSTKRVRPFLT